MVLKLVNHDFRFQVFNRMADALKAKLHLGAERFFRLRYPAIAVNQEADRNYNRHGRRENLSVCHRPLLSHNIGPVDRVPVGSISPRPQAAQKLLAELARCDREIAEIKARDNSAAPAYLPTLGIADWEHEKRLLLYPPASGARP
jgi:hypothetical protein